MPRILQPPFVEGSASEDLNAEAENTDYDGDDRVILNGNAFISRNDFQLEADRVSFLNSTGDGDAEGNVKIRRPNTLLIGDTASVNVRTNAFDLKIHPSSRTKIDYEENQNSRLGLQMVTFAWSTGPSRSVRPMSIHGICRQTRFI